MDIGSGRHDPIKGEDLDGHIMDFIAYDESVDCEPITLNLRNGKRNKKGKHKKDWQR